MLGDAGGLGSVENVSTVPTENVSAFNMHGLEVSRTDTRPHAKKSSEFNIAVEITNND